jgi:hypothetical protein
MLLIAAGNRNECWEWVGRLRPDGYPHTWPLIGGTSYRVAYETQYGPIPDGHDVHHVCRNQLCLNPFHLQAIPAAEHRRLHRAEQA